MNAYTVVGPTNRKPRRLSSFESAVDSGVVARQLAAARRAAPGGGEERTTTRTRDSPSGQLERRDRVPDRRLDLAAMADDPGVAEQPLDVALVEVGDPLDRESGERLPKALPLAQDRQPREPGLEALEREQLEQRIVAALLAPPLVVVVGAVERILSAPPAARSPVGVENEIGHRSILHGRARGRSGARLLRACT